MKIIATKEQLAEKWKTRARYIRNSLSPNITIKEKQARFREATILEQCATELLMLEEPNILGKK